MPPITDPPPIHLHTNNTAQLDLLITEPSTTTSPSPRASEAYEPISTPPSTPIDPSHTPPPSDLSTPLMFELTRSKLERAAQTQVRGGRGGPSLRQIVLLSNVWSGALPQWNQEQARERQLAIEEDDRRKSDEERWLDGVLEEMLLDEGDEEDENDRSYVSVSFRDERQVGDSGFLEEGKPHPSSSSIASPIGDPRITRDLADSLADIEEEAALEQSFTFEVTEEEQDDVLPDTDAEPAPFSLDDLPALPESAPNSPPLPPRSPPIAVPDRPTRTSALHVAPTTDIDCCSTSASPPLHPPALTPDSSPPKPVSLLSSSTDSFERDLENRFSWMDNLERPESRRLGILALDLSDSSRPIDPPAVAEEAVAVSLSFGPERPERTTSKAPVSSLSNSLALAVIPPQQQQQTWSPRPPRSLSVPASHSRTRPSPPSPPQSQPPLVPSFQAGIIKSYYDAVDMGTGVIQRPEPKRRASATTEETWAKIESLEGQNELALVLRPRSAPPYRPGQENDEPWQRSLSPETSPSRRVWLRLTDTEDD